MLILEWEKLILGCGVEVDLYYSNGNTEAMNCLLFFLSLSLLHYKKKNTHTHI